MGRERTYSQLRLFNWISSGLSLAAILVAFVPDFTWTGFAVVGILGLTSFLIEVQMRCPKCNKLLLFSRGASGFYWRLIRTPKACPHCRAPVAGRSSSGEATTNVSNALVGSRPHVMAMLNLRARTLVWWAIVVPMMGFFFSMELLGPRIVLPIMAVLYLAQLYVFLATTCPNCGCYVLGRIAKTPAFIAPFWVPRECLCCSHDLTDFPRGPLESGSV